VVVRSGTHHAAVGRRGVVALLAAVAGAGDPGPADARGRELGDG
jgi:hypothetical protein